MPHQIEISPTFKRLLQKAWGSQLGNIRIVGNGGKPSFSWHRATELETVLQTDGTSAFWSTTGFDTAASREKKLNHSKASHVGMLWVDIDGDFDRDTLDPRFSPNFIIHTSPGKAHLFFLLSTISIQDLGYDFLAEVQQTLCKTLGGDESADDLGHISRVPGSVNPKNGHVVTIEEIHDRLHDLYEMNPDARAPGQHRHELGRDEMASAASKGYDLEKRMRQLQAYSFTEPLGQQEADDLLEWADTADVRQYAPLELPDGLQVSTWDKGGKPSIVDYQYVLDDEDFEIRRNIIGGRLMTRKTVIEDGTFSAMFAKFHVKKYNQETLFLHALKAEAHSHEPFNPIIDWIEREEWDKKDHIAHLVSYFDDDESGDFAIWLKHWMVGAIAKLEKPQGAFNRMLILEGPQGIGKSEFAKWLVPVPLMSYYCQDAPVLGQNNTDTMIKIANKWIWEIQELGQHTEKHTDSLKAFLSQAMISERVPYGKFATDEIVRASFIGTVNNIGAFLTDPTGNRRYMACSLNSIDWEGYTQNVNLQQLWAQALVLYREGFNWELTGELEERADQGNAEYVVESALFQHIERLLEVDPEQTGYYMSTAEIHALVEAKSQRTYTMQAVGGAMSHMGGRKVKRLVDGKQRRVWIGVQERVQVTIE